MVLETLKEEGFSAVPVEDYDQVGESLGHGQVGDSGGPDLIGGG